MCCLILDFLTVQGLAFRCKAENLDTGGNPGNFLSLLHLKAENDETLRNHFQGRERRNATYLSRQSQNEIINITGQDFIQKRILCEIKEAKFYLILADKVSCHNVEQMPLLCSFCRQRL